MDSIERIIMALIAIVVAVSVVGVVADRVKAAQTGNVSGASSVLLGLVTLLFIVGIVVLAIRKMISSK